VGSVFGPVEKCDEKYLGRTEGKNNIPLPLQGAGFGEREYNNIAKMGIYSSDQKTFLHKDIYQYQGKPHYRNSLFKGDN
jgi:hypothetical protein